MLDGNVECYKFIDEPVQVENAFVLRHGDKVVVFGIFFSKLRCKAIVAADGLLHVVKADVARHENGAFGVAVKVEIVLGAVDIGRHTNVAALDFCVFQTLKPRIAEAEFEGGETLMEFLQIYLQIL